MDAYDEHSSAEEPFDPRPGLVLLYAPSHALLAPAYVLDPAQPDIIVGRAADAGIQLPEASVSRKHARIRYENNAWILSDVGARNGILADGEYIQEIALEHLHEIRIGDVIFKFVESNAIQYKRYRIDGTIDGASMDETVVWRARMGDITGGYQIDRIAKSIEKIAKNPVSVILLGESGTGKEAFAGWIHQVSGRKGAFRAINCASIPQPLIESELFGYKRGAFSGADRDKPGLFRAADKGTLLLDEIGDMPLEAQAKLLRVLQSKEFIPLGATSPEHADVRIICATHCDLAKMQSERKFRGDLYARLNEYSVRLPPLRERKEDIYSLCRTLLARHNRPDLELSFPFMTAILHYDFPFNIRELEGYIKRAAALAQGPVLDTAHLPDEIREHMKGYGRKHGLCEPPAECNESPRPPAASPIAHKIRTSSEQPPEHELRALLAQHKGNIAAVGRVFGKARMQVHRWIKHYSIDISEYR